MYNRRNREFLTQRVGRMEQYCKLRTVVLDEGRGRGVRLVEIDNGSGLSFTLMADRALDLYEARFKGIPLAWLSPNGIVNPAFYEPEGVMWLRSWPGGMLTTAGFLNVGGPDTARGETHGLHGRVSHLPVEQLALENRWRDSEHYELGAAGTVRHTMAFGEKLEMRRRILCTSGDNTIYLTDRLENQGFAPAPLMMLYHCNFGYPLVDAGARLEAVAHEVLPKDAAAASGIADWAKLEGPQPNYAEQVFIHRIPADADGFARMALVNPAAKLKLTVAYDTRTLPLLNQWKQMGQGEYVVGLEPGNCVPTGQSDNEKRGLLRMLAPGEVVEFNLRIGVEELA